MNLSALFVLVLYSEVTTYIKAQRDPGSGRPVVQFQHHIRPSTATVIGIIAVMLLISFLLLAYARLCYNTGPHNTNHHQLITHSRSRRSGVDRTIIESLPFFGFSSIKGSKEGLECAICLSKFEDSDVLRLLPKCKHAFHIDCIDQWWECHSSCPLCRYKFDPKDPKNFTYSSSLRFLQVNSNLSEDPNVEIFVQREEDSNSRGSSSRFDKGKEQLLIQDIDRSHAERNKLLDKLKHRIILSDVVTKDRWSDVNPSDMLFLNSEMIDVLSSQRFRLPGSSSGRSAKEDINRNVQFEAKVRDVGEKRSVSEITNFPRLKQTSAGSCYRAPYDHVNGGKEERVRRLWLPIARRTVQWFAERHKNSVQSENKRSHNVDVV